MRIWLSGRRCVRASGLVEQLVEALNRVLAAAANAAVLVGGPRRTVQQVLQAAVPLGHRDFAARRVFAEHLTKTLLQTRLRLGA
ncbi:MAG TPA: hypothetical protein VF159_01905 [Gemmatimonadaceae bacterium]